MTDSDPYFAAFDRALAAIPDVNPYLVAFELTERNAVALADWRLRYQLQRPCTDPHGPISRRYLTQRFDRQRALALRWMFKNRCEKALLGIVIRQWSRLRPPLFLSKQAE